MWDYVGERYIYRKVNNKHCSVWYDVYIKCWRWSVVVFDSNGAHTKQGKSRTASMAIQQSTEQEMT